MKTRYLIPFVTFMTACAASASAGELNVTGDLNVASNLTANSVTLGGETRTNWPSGGGVVGGAVDLTTAVVNFSQTGSLFRLTLTNHTAWVFTNHVAGREVNLQLTQDATGGWTNAWPSDLLWPDGQPVTGSTVANHFDVFKILDNGTEWLVVTSSRNYATNWPTTQLLRPSGDVQSYTWQSAPLWSKINDCNDGTFISVSNPSIDDCYVTLQSGSDPQTTSGHVLHARVRGSGSQTDVQIRLVDVSNSEIATLYIHAELPTSFTEYTYTLDGSEATYITDYQALQIRIKAQGNGFSGSVSVADVWLELPLP